jgi:hypothetical protein
MDLVERGWGGEEWGKFESSYELGNELSGSIKC